MKRMHLILVCLSAFILAANMARPSAGQLVQTPESMLVDTATVVLQEIMAVPARQIPHALLRQAHAVAIVPNVLKGSLVLGVRRGHGVLLLRDDQGNWQPPTFITLTGGSVGWQIGVQSTDVILVFRTRRGIDNLTRGKLTVGIDLAAAAGPVGREANLATDAGLQAEILSYSRSRGLFAGVALDGTVLKPDPVAGMRYYQTLPSNMGAASDPSSAVLPPSAARLINLLSHLTDAPQPAPNRLVAGVAPTPIDTSRDRLMRAWQRLQPLLDAQWRAYLALPPGVSVANGPPPLAAIETLRQRLDRVAGDARYAALTRRVEFGEFHDALKAYEAACRESIQNAPLTLPAPPTKPAP